MTSDTTHDDETESTTESDTTHPDDEPEEAGIGLPSREQTLIRLYWVAVAGVVLLGAFAVIRLYSSVSRAISIWIASEYEPILQAGFNLIVLLVALLLAAVLVRRLNAISD